jgi:regulator of protease activity HflC (stomatin/prohibitin superfamily)
MVPAVFGRRSEESGGSAPRVNVVAIAVLLASIAFGVAGSIASGNPAPLVVMLLAGLVLMRAPRIAQQWERAIVLRLGRFHAMRGPGLFWIIPFVDAVSSWIDQRTITTSFAAEQTLTSDTVPVSVDAVLFWMVHDVQKAALEVQDYSQAVSWAAQTALRDIIGRTELTVLLRGREKIEQELQLLIDARSNPWGVTVQSVEMRDVVIPVALQDAMSREAQAAREKQARIILGEAELAIAHSFSEAAKEYHTAAAGRRPGVEMRPMRPSKGYRIQMAPDAVETSMRGPPPPTWPCNCRRDTFPTRVIGCSESILPELLCALRSNAALAGTCIVTFPDAAPTFQAPAGSPSTVTAPLPARNRTGPCASDTVMLPERVVTSVRPWAVRRTDTGPLPV